MALVLSARRRDEGGAVTRDETAWTWWTFPPAVAGRLAQRYTSASGSLPARARLVVVRVRAVQVKIVGPLTTGTSSLSRSLADTPRRRSGHVEAGTAQIPKLTLRVRFPSPALTTKALDPASAAQGTVPCWPPRQALRESHSLLPCGAGLITPGRWTGNPPRR